MKWNLSSRSNNTPSTAQRAMADVRHPVQPSTPTPNTAHRASSSSATSAETFLTAQEDQSSVATIPGESTTRTRRRIHLGRLAKRAGMRVFHASQSSLVKFNPLRLLDMISTKTAKSSKYTDEDYVIVNPLRPLPPVLRLYGHRASERDEVGEPRASSSSSSVYEYAHDTPNTRHPNRQPVDEVPMFHGWSAFCGTQRPPKMVSPTHWYDVVAQQEAERARLANEAVEAAVEAAIEMAEAYETRLRHAVEEVIRECEEEARSSTRAVLQEHDSGDNLKLDTRTTVRYTHDLHGYSTPVLTTPADTLGSSGPPSRIASTQFMSFRDDDNDD